MTLVNISIFTESQPFWSSIQKNNNWWSGKINTFLNLKSSQPDTDKLHLYTKDLHEAKYQLTWVRLMILKLLLYKQVTWMIFMKVKCNPHEKRKKISESEKYTVFLFYYAVVFCGVAILYWTRCTNLFWKLQASKSFNNNSLDSDFKGTL